MLFQTSHTRESETEGPVCEVGVQEQAASGQGKVGGVSPVGERAGQTLQTKVCGCVCGGLINSLCVGYV